MSLSLNHRAPVLVPTIHFVMGGILQSLPAPMTVDVGAYSFAAAPFHPASLRSGVGDMRVGNRSSDRRTIVIQRNLARLSVRQLLFPFVDCA